MHTITSITKTLEFANRRNHSSREAIPDTVQKLKRTAAKLMFCLAVCALTVPTVANAQQTTPSFAFTDDFEDGSVSDDSPVSLVSGGLPSTLNVVDGDLILTEPFPLEGFSIGLTNVTKGGKLVHAGDASAKAVVRVSDAFAFAGIYTRGQTTENGGDGGAYFGNIRGDGLITTGSFTGAQLTLETPLDPVTTDVVLQVDTIGTHVIATAWATDNPAAKYSITFVDTVARPAGFMGQSFGRGGDDATGASATFKSLQVLEPLLGDMNGDGTLGVSDIEGFIFALVDSQEFLERNGISPLIGDLSGDGLLNVSDIDPFVALMTGALQGAEPQLLKQLATLTSPDSDDDGDGKLNGQELLDGTDPSNSADFLHMTAIQATQSGFELEWASVEGRRYEIQSSVSAEPDSWTAINAEVIESVGDRTRFTAPMPEERMAFFRAVVLP